PRANRRVERIGCTAHCPSSTRLLPFLGQRYGGEFRSARYRTGHHLCCNLLRDWLGWPWAKLRGGGRQWSKPGLRGGRRQGSRRSGLAHALHLGVTRVELLLHAGGHGALVAALACL